MAYTEAQKRATLKYHAEKLDDIRIRVPKGTKAAWMQKASNSGKSLTRYIIDKVESDK